MLGLVDPATTFVMNDPRGLVNANEKLCALNFACVIPESVVTSDHGRLKAFMEQLGGEMIVKPLDGCGGSGVLHVHRNDRNLNALLELSTGDGKRLVMAQRYLTAARDGDKRLIVLDGEPLGAVLRVPRDDEHRGNIHVGGQVKQSPVDDRDREICRTMAPRLRGDGLYFVGLDIIGGYVTEVNVTSPTGVQEIDRLDNTNLEAKSSTSSSPASAKARPRARAAQLNPSVPCAGDRAHSRGSRVARGPAGCPQGAYGAAAHRPATHQRPTRRIEAQRTPRGPATREPAQQSTRYARSP